MNKKAFVVMLILSVVVTWLTKEAQGVLNFSLGGLNAGLPLNFYKCSFISSCSVVYGLLIFDIAFWFVVIWLIWKILQKATRKK